MIFLVGNYGFGSAGDEAVLSAIAAQVRARRPDLRIVAASGNPEQTAAAHNVEAVAADDFEAVCRTVELAGLVILGGVVLRDTAGLASYARPAVLASLYRTPVALVSAGAGPLESNDAVRLTRAICDSAQWIGVRDCGSGAALERAGAAAEKIRVTAHAAFAFEPVPTASQAAQPKPVIGVADGAGVAERTLSDALSLAVEQTGGSVLRIALDAPPDRVANQIRSCDVVLATHLDALVFAASSGVPAVAWSAHPEMNGLAKRLGWEAWLLDARDQDAAVVAAKLIHALAGPAGNRAQELREEVIASIPRVLALLDSPAPPAAVPGAELVDDRRVIRRELEELNERCRVLEASSADLRARMQLASEQRRAAENRAEESERQVREVGARAAQERALVLAGLDRFRALYEQQLAVYHSQRAWQVMLVVRKAYALLHERGLGAFLRWAIGLPFLRWGRLEEYDLKFPDIAGYIPDSFRASTLGAGEAAAAEPVRGIETPAQRERYDVVILAIIDFDFRFQRPQQIAAELARRGHRVFWISPTRFLPGNAAKPYEVHPLRENLWEIHLKSRQPDIYLGELKTEDVHSLADALDALYRDWTISEHAVLVQLPFWRRLALELRAAYGGKLLYDCMDDWETFENMGKFNVSEEKMLVRETDVLVVTGAELERKFQAQGLKPVLARNGADYPFFAQAGSNTLLADVARPVVGYFGAIADWIDLELVYEVARLRPQYSFVLIGQVFGRDTSKLEALPNVRLLGNKPYADIPAYLYQFDACTIPFLINQVTKATDPVKLYEYFSLGKPVIATNLAELAQCGDLLYIASGAEEFAAKVDLAVAEKDPALAERRIEFAKANTWARRVDAIDGAVRDTFPLVSVLIVTYNSGRFVRPCLDSVLRNGSYPSYEVILVDNASTDNTAALLEEYASKDARVRLFRMAGNLGFAGGNNYAARQAKGEYLVFLNVDTIVTPGWIGRLVRHVERDRSIGLLCPVTNFAGNEIKINVNYTAFAGMEKFARELAAQKSGQKIDIRVAPLYCALMPRKVWERVGEMDTRYEIGMFEDDDLSIRVRRAGFGVYAAEDCFIHHFGQGSFSKLASETYNRIFEANRKRFEEKWNEVWVAHKTRPGVRPAYEEKKFEPEEF
jgi:GT2 family glycosyltransferase/polysaccharide pyruvyl transferase WcaK-like protein/glycosyltransferase involved in cell wall biosynthesis